MSSSLPPHLKHRIKDGLQRLGAAKRFLVAALILLSASWLHAQIPPQFPSSNCVGANAAFSGTYPINPGRWFATDRRAISWDFHFNNAGALTAYWYGFDARGNPTWYISETAPIRDVENSADRIWHGKLYRAAISFSSTLNNNVVSLTEVGNIFARFAENSPDDMAVNWDVNSNTRGSNECLIRRRAGQTQQRTVDENYSGYWYAPSNTGWGNNVLILPTGVNSSVSVEENAVLIYDASGAPVWLMATQQLTGQNPPSQNLQLQLTYSNWKPFGDSLANVNGLCTSNCTVTQTTTQSASSGFLRRSYTTAGTGTLSVAINQEIEHLGYASPGTAPRQTIDFVRGTPTPLNAQKLTNAHGITVNPAVCTVASNSRTCPVTVGWSNLAGFYGSDARPVRREILGNGQLSTPVAISSLESGSLVENLEAGKRYQYQLFNFARNAAVVTTSEVRAVRDASAEIPDDERGLVASEFPANSSSTLAGATTIQADTVGGAATLSVPIQLPPGRRGMQPSVSLGYSSRAGNGIAGMGFSLNATMAISRCPQTLASDGVVGSVRYDANDRLCLDGQRLIVLPNESGNSGGYGSQGSTYGTELESDVRVTQLGGSLSLATRNGAESATYFKVETKAGEVLYFGADVNGYELDGKGNATFKVRPPGASRTLTWLLHTRLDRSGNNVHYQYRMAGQGEHVLDSIAYTGHNGGTGDRVVRFGYEPRPDRSSSYLAGGLTEQTVRLKTITTEVATVPVRTYTLNYQTSAISGRSVLGVLQECFPNAKCLPQQVFTFSKDRAQPVNKRLSLGLAGGPADAGIFGQYPSGLQEIGDLDGDGTSEFAYEVRQVGSPVPQASFVLRSSGAERNFQAPVNAFTALSGREISQDWRGDFNNDGIGDLLTRDASTGRLDVRLGNPNATWGAGFFSAAIDDVQLSVPFANAVPKDADTQD